MKKLVMLPEGMRLEHMAAEAMRAHPLFFEKAHEVLFITVTDGVSAMRKLLLTRLGLEYRSKKDPSTCHADTITDYMSKVLKILVNYTYHSVRNQTFKDFEWVFVTGELFEKVHRDFIEDRIDLPVKFVKIEDIENLYKHEKKLITYRLDADDYMHPELLELVTRALEQYHDNMNVVISGPVNGYVYMDGVYTKHSNKGIAIGQAVISSVGATVWHNHRKLYDELRTLYPSVNVIEKYLENTKPLYVYNRTSHSHSLVEGRRVYNSNKATAMGRAVISSVLARVVSSHRKLYDRLRILCPTVDVVNKYLEKTKSPYVYNWTSHSHSLVLERPRRNAEEIGVVDIETDFLIPTGWEHR